MKPFNLPIDLSMGVATAATHINGGPQKNNWGRWSDMGQIADDSHCKVACDHLNRIESDTNLIKQLNCSTYRLGVDWSAIEPERGVYDEESLDVLDREIQLLMKNNIRPLVTLWHFTNPLWIEDQGGWINSVTVDSYLKFVDLIVNRFGKIVQDWITINEPNVYLFFAYFDGVWPPGKKGDVRSFLKGARNFCHAHIQAYDLIHDIYHQKHYQAPLVGVAHHLRVLDPADRRWISRKATDIQRFLFQDIFLEAMTTGSFRMPLVKPKGIEEGLYSDFLGINYYSRDQIRGNFNPLKIFGERSAPDWRFEMI